MMRGDRDRVAGIPAPQRDVIQLQGRADLVKAVSDRRIDRVRDRRRPGGRLRRDKTLEAEMRRSWLPPAVPRG